MNTLDIYIDQLCAIYVKFGQVIKRIDVLNKINQKDKSNSKFDRVLQNHNSSYVSSSTIYLRH